ncbi:MAG: thiosulfate oxidation carrier protein SoxY [Burkholderiales bacterium]
MTQENRRTFLNFFATFGAAAVLGLLNATRALAAQWNSRAFDARALEDTLAGLGATAVEDSDQIVLRTPEIAENGAIVPVEIESRIAGTRFIHVLVDKNAQPLAASFEFADGADPFVALRIKMSESSNVRVIVHAAGRFYRTANEVKVTIGGCGG